MWNIYYFYHFNSYKYKNYKHNFDALILQGHEKQKKNAAKIKFMKGDELFNDLTTFKF